jgi:dUTP pyrophosphatase
LISRDELTVLCSKKPALVEEAPDLQNQIQTNGIDLTLQKVVELDTRGSIGTVDSERLLPPSRIIRFDEDGWVLLSKGCYRVTFNEIVNIPNDMAAIARSRSSLLRCGVSLETAVWDAGYSGRSESLLVVSNEDGFKVKKNARLVQLVFFKLNQPVSKGYSGIYQGENH